MYEKQSRNTNRSSDTIASFLLKTYQILEHPEYQRMISWDKSNVGFIIHDVVCFTREILPKYFRHSNFSSFVRQLNMYDFHKVKQENQSLVFKNPLFCKGEQQNLKFIRRKAAKKIGGQRKPQNNDRVDAENEKYENLLKGFKKSFETQINHSSFFYERSIQLMKDLNDSNMKKGECIKKLYEKEEQCETREEQKEKIEEQEVGRKVSESGENEEKERKDTVIQIPKEFLEQKEEKLQKPQQQVKRQQQHSTPTSVPIKVEQKQPTPSSGQFLNIDRILQLKQELYKSLGVYQSWLQDYIEINKKKVKYMNSTRQQLVKCRENKNLENQGDGYGNEGENERQEEGNEENDGQEGNEEQKPISLEEINERNQQDKSEKEEENVKDHSAKAQINNEKQPIQEQVPSSGSHLVSILPMLRVFQQSSSNKQLEKSNQKMNGFQQGGFIPMINESFSSRLFSTFTKPKEEKVVVKEEFGQENGGRGYKEENGKGKV